MYLLVYFLIVLFATTIGSLSGMGGGVIIKPSLDALSYSNLDNINFYSSLAVLSMSIVSIYKKYRQGDIIALKEILAIGFGSIIGGNIGASIFKYSIASLSDDNVKLIQIAITVIILSISIYYTTYLTYSLKLKNIFFYFLMSLFLGIISTFLGIGGGPINVSLFIFVLGVDMKRATLYSIATIFLSQLSKNFSDVFITGLSGYILFPLIVILPAAIIGGNIGTKINIRSSNLFVKKAYNFTTMFVIFLNIFNAFRIIIK